MAHSRQQIAFEKWKQDFIQLVLTDRKLSPSRRKDLEANLLDLFEYPGIYENMVQAFSNFMWSMDKKIEKNVCEELAIVAKIIPDIVSDKESTDVLAIQDFLQKISEEWKEGLEPLTDGEIDRLVPDSEVDDSRPEGL